MNTIDQLIIVISSILYVITSSLIMLYRISKKYDDYIGFFIFPVMFTNILIVLLFYKYVIL